MSECKKCGGEGERSYPTTAVWMGGPAGQAFTMGTCDVCWGSGDEKNPGPNLRVKMALERSE